jgi:hypothetical protein
MCLPPQPIDQRRAAHDLGPSHDLWRMAVLAGRRGPPAQLHGKPRAVSLQGMAERHAITLCARNLRPMLQKIVSGRPVTSSPAWPRHTGHSE